VIMSSLALYRCLSIGLVVLLCLLRKLYTNYTSFLVHIRISLEGKMMQLTRLSRIETVPSPAPTPKYTPPSPRSFPIILLRLATFTLLLLSFILIFLALLLPNRHTHLSSMTIKPVNKIVIPSTLVASSTTSTPMSLPTGVWGQDQSEIGDDLRNRLSAQKVKTPLGSVTWFGIMGPKIWVGPMRQFLPTDSVFKLMSEICSRSDRDSDIICTSSSTPTFRMSPLKWRLKLRYRCSSLTT
jgi:hypothetical protein